MKKSNFFYYMMLVGNAFADQPTPAECEMQRKFLQGETPKEV